MNLAERAQRTEQVLERFRDKPFSWQGANCIRLARAQAAAMGHSVPPVPVFRSALGAKKALAKQGAASVTELLDAHFERLPAPAFAWVGDICVLPAADEHGLEAVCIADGRGNVFGWHQETNFEKLESILQAEAGIVTAWALGRG
jgi:hypothetical protein